MQSLQTIYPFETIIETVGDFEGVIPRNDSDRAELAVKCAILLANLQDDSSREHIMKNFIKYVCNDSSVFTDQSNFYYILHKLINPTSMNIYLDDLFIKIDFFAKGRVADDVAKQVLEMPVKTVEEFKARRDAEELYFKQTGRTSLYVYPKSVFMKINNKDTVCPLNTSAALHRATFLLPRSLVPQHIDFVFIVDGMERCFNSRAFEFDEHRNVNFILA